MKKIYLASPFFNEKELIVYKKVIKLLRNLKDVDVFVPMEHEIENGMQMPNKLWAQKVFEIDKKAIDRCDYVFVLNFGMYSDSGTAWEAGYAFAKGKKVYQVLCGEANTEYSLMMTNGNTHVITLADLRKNKLPEREDILSKIIQK